MTGDRRGDISKDSFDPTKHFLRVLSQQGRVQIDADSNEQIDILLHYIQTLARDIIGPFAGDGFGIGKFENGTFDIGYGRYYVDGILCENEKIKGIDYHNQPDYPIKDLSIPSPTPPFLVYLDVWERHISCVEDDHIREKALGGPDTATRSKVIWQVKVLNGKNIYDCKGFKDVSSDQIKNIWTANVVDKILQKPNRGRLKARARTPPEDASSPCTISPEARYRGAENQLYRVEIHREGKAKQSNPLQSGAGDALSSDYATFKWSRENSAVVFPIRSKTGAEVTLEHLGRDERSSLKAGDWVEVIDDDYSLLILSRPSPLLEANNNNKPRPLAQVSTVDMAEMKVTLKDGPALPDYDTKDKHPLLRRWDYKEEQDGPELADKGASGLFVVEGGCSMDADNDKWLTLEDGVQICFQKGNPVNQYQVGDYWPIPARTETGDVEWPGEIDAPVALPPHGIEHHYAPLAIITSAADLTDCRPAIKNIGICPT